MTNEKMIEMLTLAIRMLKDSSGHNLDAKEILDFSIRSGGKASAAMAYPEFLISDVVYALQEQIIKEEAKKSGKTGRLNACKKLVKQAQTLTKTEFHYPWDCGEYQCICDGYTLVVLKDRVAIDRPEHSETPDKAFIERQLKNKAGKEAYLPELSTLKSAYKVNKAMKTGKDKRVAAEIGGQNFDVEKLIQLMEIIDSRVITLQKRAMRIEDKSGNIGILMGMYKYSGIKVDIVIDKNGNIQEG